MKELVKEKKVVLANWNALTNIPNIAIVASTVKYHLWWWYLTVPTIIPPEPLTGEG